VPAGDNPSSPTPITQVWLLLSQRAPSGEGSVEVGSDQIGRDPWPCSTLPRNKRQTREGSPAARFTAVSRKRSGACSAAPREAPSRYGRYLTIPKPSAYFLLNSRSLLLEVGIAYWQYTYRREEVRPGRDETRCDVMWMGLRCRTFKEAGAELCP
jgi:hypothetical protein